MLRNIVKRDGRIVLYDESKIAGAIWKAMEATKHGRMEDALQIAKEIGSTLNSRDNDKSFTTRPPGKSWYILFCLNICFNFSRMTI